MHVRMLIGIVIAMDRVVELCSVLSAEQSTNDGIDTISCHTAANEVLEG